MYLCGTQVHHDLYHARPDPPRPRSPRSHAHNEQHFRGFLSLESNTFESYCEFHFSFSVWVMGSFRMPISKVSAPESRCPSVLSSDAHQVHRSTQRRLLYISVSDTSRAYTYTPCPLPSPMDTTFPCSTWGFRLLYLWFFVFHNSDTFFPPPPLPPHFIRYNKETKTRGEWNNVGKEQ